LHGDRRRDVGLRITDDHRELLRCTVYASTNVGVVQIDGPVLATHVAASRPRLLAKVLTTAVTAGLSSRCVASWLSHPVAAVWAAAFGPLFSAAARIRFTHGAGSKCARAHQLAQTTVLAIHPVHAAVVRRTFAQ